MGLKGAIRGIGTALTYAGQQGMAEQQQARRDQVLADREAALARLRAQLQEGAANSNLAREKELDTFRTNNNIRGKAAELQVAAPYREKEIKLQGEVQGQRDAQQHQYTISEITARASADEKMEINREARQARQKGDEFVHWTEDGATGNVVGVTRTGRVWDSGIKYRTDKGRDDDDYRPSTRAPEAPSTARVAKPGDIITDGRGRKMKMNASGKWVPM
jgi:hypothetical protein